MKIIHPLIHPVGDDGKIRLEDMINSLSQNQLARGSNRSDKLMAFANAYHYAIEKHRGHFRRDINIKTGKNYEFVIHPMRVSSILINLGADIITCIGGLLHDISDVSSDANAAGKNSYEIRKLFGGELGDLHDALTKVHKTNARTKIQKIKEKEDDLLSLLFDSLGTPRVFYIKAADRFENLLSLDVLDFHQQVRIYTETVEAYLPIVELIDKKLHHFYEKELEKHTHKLTPFYFLQDYNNVSAAVNIINYTHEARTMQFYKSLCEDQGVSYLHLDIIRDSEAWFKNRIEKYNEDLFNRQFEKAYFNCIKAMIFEDLGNIFPNKVSPIPEEYKSKYIIKDLKNGMKRCKEVAEETPTMMKNDIINFHINNYEHDEDEKLDPEGEYKVVYVGRIDEIRTRHYTRVVYSRIIEDYCSDKGNITSTENENMKLRFNEKGLDITKTGEFVSLSGDKITYIDLVHNPRDDGMPVLDKLDEVMGKKGAFAVINKDFPEGEGFQVVYHSGLSLIDMVKKEEKSSDNNVQVIIANATFDVPHPRENFFTVVNLRPVI